VDVAFVLSDFGLGAAEVNRAGVMGVVVDAHHVQLGRACSLWGRQGFSRGACAPTLPTHCPRAKGRSN
jgi:hypothetical protein